MYVLARHKVWSIRALFGLPTPEHMLNTTRQPVHCVHSVTAVNELPNGVKNILR